MKLAVWENPGNKNDIRVYANGLVGQPKDVKVYLVANGEACRLKASPETAQPQALAAFIASGGQEILDQDFDAVVAMARAPSTRSPRPPKAKAPRSVIAGDREAAAAELDLTTIPVPEPVTIGIDHREPEALFTLLSNLPNVTVTREALGVGDIEINGGDILIERKCCTGEARTDFESSVIDDDKRLFFQSEKLKLQSDCVPIVMIEGPVHEASQSMLVQAVDGALSFLITIQGMSVINTLNLNHSAYMILKLAVHAKSGLGYDLALRGKKPVQLSNQLAFTLEGLPGVSARTAKALADKFGTMAGLVAATQQEILTVPGLGKKRLEGIWRVLHGE